MKSWLCDHATLTSITRQKAVQHCMLSFDQKMNQKQQAVQHCLWSLNQSKGPAALTLKSDSLGIPLFILLWSESAHRQVITKLKDLQRAAGGHGGRHVLCRLCSTAALEKSNLALDAFVQKCCLDGRKASTCSNG